MNLNSTLVIWHFFYILEFYVAFFAGLWSFGPSSLSFFLVSARGFGVSMGQLEILFIFWGFGILVSNAHTFL